MPMYRFNLILIPKISPFQNSKPTLNLNNKCLKNRSKKEIFHGLRQS